MKLLIINDFGINGGGTENRIKILIDYFVRNNIFQEIHVIQWRSNRNKPLNDKRVIIHHCPAKHFASYFFTKNIIKKYKIDFVQAHNMMALTPSPVLAAKRLKKPVVWYAHDYWAMCTLRNFINPYNAIKGKLCGKVEGKRCTNCRSNLKSSLKLWLWKNLLNKADVGVATGRIMVRLYERENILKGKWKIVVPWIDPRMLNKNQKTSLKRKEKIGNKILFVGSLLDFKGAWVAVKSLKYVLKNVPDAQLIFIGGEQEKKLPYRRRVETLAKKDNVLKNIRFLGKKRRKEIKRYLSEARVYVCPTVCMESFGQNWAEAMASGCPVVASDIATIPEHINGKNGLVFKIRDHKELAEKISTIIKNKKLACQISEKGAKYANKNFDIEKNGKDILNIYDKLLKKR